jgi:hypothetical protein
MVTYPPRKSSNSGLGNVWRMTTTGELRIIPLRTGYSPASGSTRSANSKSFYRDWKDIFSIEKLSVQSYTFFVLVSKHYLSFQGTFAWRGIFFDSIFLYILSTHWFFYSHSKFFTILSQFRQNIQRTWSPDWISWRRRHFVLQARQKFLVLSGNWVFHGYFF